MSVGAADDLVVGAIDMHCHHGPDPHRVRSVDAAEAVVVDYDELPAVFDAKEALLPGAPLVCMRVNAMGQNLILGVLVDIL